MKLRRNTPQRQSKSLWMAAFTLSRQLGKNLLHSVTASRTFLTSMEDLMTTHLALITIIDPGLSIGYPLPPVPPLGTWGGVAPPYPAHPIAPGGPSGPPPWGIQLPPLGTWGGVAPPYPAHPIAPGGPPPGTWGGGNVPY